MIKADFEKEYSRSMRLLSSEVIKQYFGTDFWKNVDREYAKKKN